MLLTLGLFITVVGVVIALASPFAGLLFYWAWLLIRPQEVVLGLGGQLPLERILAFTLIVSLILHRKVPRRPSCLTSFVFPALGAFLVVNYFSILTSIWKSNSLLAANNFAKLVIFCVCAVELLDSPSRIHKFLWVYVLAIGEEAATSLINYQMHPYYAQGIQRATSLAVSWMDPNTTAANLALAIPFLFVLSRNNRSWLKRSFLAVLLSVDLTCIVLTGSRMGWVLSLFVLFWLACQARKRLFWAPALVCILVASQSLVPIEYQRRYGTIVSFLEDPKGQIKSSEGASAYGRIVGFVVAWKIFCDNPILGVGANNFADAFWSLDYSYAGTKGYFQPHNLPGQILSELGILGALSFGLYVFVVLRTNRTVGRCLKDLRDPPILVVAIHSTTWLLISALLVEGFSAHNAYRYNWYLVAVLVVASHRAILSLKVKQAPQSFILGEANEETEIVSI